MTLAAVPAGLVEVTVRAATHGALGGMIPVAVARLAEGVLRTMFLNRLSAAAAALILVAALATGASGWAWQAKDRGDEPTAKVDHPPQAKPAGGALVSHRPDQASNLTNLTGRVVDGR